jgi:hypothetical protein
VKLKKNPDFVSSNVHVYTNNKFVQIVSNISIMQYFHINNQNRKISILTTGNYLYATCIISGQLKGDKMPWQETWNSMKYSTTDYTPVVKCIKCDCNI